MKHLKIYENFKPNYNIFDVGDYVVTYGHKVFEIIKKDVDRYLLLNINDTKHEYWETESWLSMATEEDIEKYKMKKDIEKYNL